MQKLILFLTEKGPIYEEKIISLEQKSKKSND